MVTSHMYRARSIKSIKACGRYVKLSLPFSLFTTDPGASVDPLSHFGIEPADGTQADLDAVRELSLRLKLIDK